jgi:hypothetical protein
MSLVRLSDVDDWVLAVAWASLCEEPGICSAREE